MPKMRRQWREPEQPVAELLLAELLLAELLLLLLVVAFVRVCRLRSRTMCAARCS
jgi:hypothetical protein